MSFHPVPSLFLKDSPPANNILIGDDPLQIRFVEQLTGQTCKTVDAVTDEDVLGKEGMLFRILTVQGLNLSQAMRQVTGVWTVAPIQPNSIAASRIIQAASRIRNDDNVERETLESAAKNLGKSFERGEIADLRVGLWNAVWLLSGPIPSSKWEEPWENPSPDVWMPRGVDPQYRLNTLAKHLAAYVLVKTNAEEELRKRKIRPSVIREFQNLKLDLNKVYASMKELARWKYNRSNPYPTALRLTQIWQP